MRKTRHERTAPERGDRHVALRAGGEARGQPKGRAVDPQALAEVQALLGDAPRRRDLLIEFLHRIQDAHGHHLRRARRRAGAGDEARDDRGLRSRDVLSSLRRREGGRSAAAAAHRARLRDAVVPDGRRRCAARGARRSAAARTCASSARPCIGRCEHAPAAVVGRNRSIARRVKRSSTRVDRARAREPTLPRYIDFAAYRADGGYRTLRGMPRRQAHGRTT